MTGPFITAKELAGKLATETGSARPQFVFDASAVLHSPDFDGDYRRDSGYPRWLAAHIPGSRHVDVPSQFSDPRSPLHHTHPEPQAIADELARLGVGRGDAVVVYDSTGTLWAARLWYLLRWIGVDVRVLDGGLQAWTDAGLPIATGEGSDPAATARWLAEAATAAWVDLDELRERGADDDRVLVCGLPAGSFHGTVPTRYARRGRIPNSVNVSSRDLFANSGAVLAAAEIEEAYAAAGVRIDRHAPEVLLYCGGGISASANALTLAAVGFDAVRIYDGSLEEWAANPSLPVEVG